MKRSLAPALVFFPLGRIQRIVAKELVQRTMQSIRSRFGNGAHDRTGLAAVLRGVIVCDDLKFLDRLRARQLTRCGLRIARKIRIADAVEQIDVLIAARTGDGQLVSESRKRSRSRRALDDSRLQERKLCQIASVEGKVSDLLLINEIGNGCSCRFDLSGVAHYGDRIAHLADLKRKIDYRILPDCQTNPFVHKGLESGQTGAHFVVPGRKTRRLILSALLRECRARDPRIRVFQRYCCARYCCAGLICDSPRDPAGRKLTHDEYRNV